MINVPVYFDERNRRSNNGKPPNKTTRRKNKKDGPETNTTEICRREERRQESKSVSNSQRATMKRGRQRREHPRHDLTTTLRHVVSSVDANRTFQRRLLSMKRHRWLIIRSSFLPVISNDHMKPWIRATKAKMITVTFILAVNDDEMFFKLKIGLFGKRKKGRRRKRFSLVF